MKIVPEVVDMPSHCAVCGNKEFSTWQEYTQHMHVSHGVHIRGQRPKRETVARAEATWLKPYIVGLECEADCHCQVCVLKALDRLIAEQTKIIEGAKNGLDK